MDSLMLWLYVPEPDLQERAPWCQWPTWTRTKRPEHSKEKWCTTSILGKLQWWSLFLYPSSELLQGFCHTCEKCPRYLYRWRNETSTAAKKRQAMNTCRLLSPPLQTQPLFGSLRGLHQPHSLPLRRPSARGPSVSPQPSATSAEHRSNQFIFYCL